MMPNYQKATLRDIEVKVGIGIFDWERKKKQKISVDVDLFSFKTRFKGKDIKDCINYDLPYGFVMGWAKRKHTDLLETLAEELVAFCLKIKGVDAVRVHIRKPEVYKDKCVPGIEFFRVKKK
jgi:FolB domain-containing protein